MQTTAGNAINWSQYPFVRILVIYSAAILAGSMWNIPPGIALWPAAIILAAALAVYLLFPGQRSLRSASVAAALFVAVYFLTACRQDLVSVPAGEGSAYSGLAILAVPLNEKPRTYQAVLEFPVPVGEIPGRSLVYIRKTARASRLLPGDKIFVDLAVRPLDEPKLPGQFNYAAYLRRRNIISTAFLDSVSWEYSGQTDSRYLIRRYSAIWRSELERVIEQQIESPASGLVKAMVLGLRDELDLETREAFAGAGIMHILAVSGLHVSILWLLVATVHRPLTRHHRYTRVTGILLEITTVWTFALLTGFGPAVQRAALMFSLLSVSRLSQLKGQAVNLTAASAVLLLVTRPQFLFEAGFQLSYAAVFGILLLYRKIHGLFYFRNRLLRYVWSLEAVSFSAVAGTAPLSVFYFHQFPLVFPLTNILAVPAAFCIVAGTMGLFTLYRLPLAGSILANLLERITNTLTAATAAAAGHQGSVLHPVYIDQVEAIMMYVLLAALIATLHGLLSRKNGLFCGLLLVSLFCLYRGTAAASEYADPEQYIIEADHGNGIAMHMIHVGSKQYIFPVAPCRSCNYLRPQGNWKFDRIMASDTLYADPLMLQNLAEHRPPALD
jgi:competence protein ComEC